jgi:prepilin-type N-terminal cleavage/methylation domain-containing protein
MLRYCFTFRLCYCSSMKRAVSGQRGFTILEVLIVLIIAGLILIIVFYAVPAANRNARNYSRKNAVNYVAGEMNSYYDTNGKFPMSGPAVTEDKSATFVNFLKSGGVTSKFDIRYTDENGSHQYPYNTYDASWAMDEISIEPGHRCNTDPLAQPGDEDYPLLTANGGDLNFKAYVVWTQLENARIYCVDNGYKG